MLGVQSGSKEFGTWLRERRRELDLTQEELANRVGCSPDAVRKIELGQRRPSRQVAELIAEALGVTPNERSKVVRWARAGYEADKSQLINPYKGLQAFDEVDALYFFGREALTQRLLSRLSEPGPLSRFLAVVGPSGSGKSSVVRAGLIPSLRSVGLPPGNPIEIISIVPGTFPSRELQVACSQSSSPGSNPDASLLIFVDQFEELFTLTCDETERRAFLADLYRIVTDSQSGTWVVVTLRADFYDRPLMYTNASRLFAERAEVVGPMSAQEMNRAITGPAEQASLMLEAGLVELIERDVGEQPGSLPLMEYALTELFEQRDGFLLTLEAYRASGGVRGALGRRSEEIYSRLSSAEQGETRWLFQRLVTLGEGVEDTRRRARRAELASAAADEEALDRVLDAFGRYRLLTFDRDPITRGPTVEIAHEALLKSWERLCEWLDSDRVDLRTQRQLMQAANEWESAGRDQSFLARGTKLAAFEALAEGVGSSGSVSLTSEERDFVRASVVLRGRERTSARRRVRLAIGGLLVALLAISVFALVALLQARSASEQRSVAVSREVAAESLAEVNGDSMRSLLLGLEAAKISPTQESENAIRQALLELQPPHTLYDSPEASGSMDFSPDSKRIILAEHEGPVRILDAQSGDILAELDHNAVVDAVQYSPDGKRIAGGSRDHNVWIWDAQTGHTMFTLTGHTSLIVAVSFSPNSEWVASGSVDSTARVWDASSGKLVSQLLGHTGPVNSVQFSPDGRRVVTASDDKTARVWDAASGKQLFALQGHEDIVNMAAFSPDGKWIVTASQDDTARLWDAATGKEIARLNEHTDSVNAARFSPDGKSLATASNDGTARLWDVADIQKAAESGKPPVAYFVLQSGPAMDALFSSDGKWIVTTCSSPGPGHQWVARVWKTGTGDSVAQLGGQDLVHESPYSRAYPTARFSPDGKWLLVADGHAIGRVLQWEFYQPLDYLLTIAPRYVTRQLTCEERQTYLHEEESCGVPPGQSSANGVVVGATQTAGPVAAPEATRTVSP